MSPGHQGAGGVVEDGHHTNIVNTHTIQALPQHPHHVLSNHPGTVEALGPVDEKTFVQSQLCHGKGEGEAQGNGRAGGQVVPLNEILDTASKKLEQICPRS